MEGKEKEVTSKYKFKPPLKLICKKCEVKYEKPESFKSSKSKGVLKEYYERCIKYCDKCSISIFHNKN